MLWLLAQCVVGMSGSVSVTSVGVGRAGCTVAIVMVEAKELERSNLEALPSSVHVLFFQQRY